MNVQSSANIKPVKGIVKFLLRRTVCTVNVFTRNSEYNNMTILFTFSIQPCKSFIIETHGHPP